MIVLWYFILVHRLDSLYLGPGDRIQEVETSFTEGPGISAFEELIAEGKMSNKCVVTEEEFTSGVRDSY